jgi:PilZ domain
MASTRAMLERRRSSRIPLRIPVKVFRRDSAGEITDAAAESVAVSRYGAQLRAPFAPELGSRIEVLHGHSHELREFRVVSAKNSKEDGLFELGVEILHPAQNNFWGVQFPDEWRQS